MSRRVGLSKSIFGKYCPGHVCLCVFIQELLDKYDVSVLPTFVAVKDGDKASYFALLN